MDLQLTHLAVLACAYLLGSVPFSYLVARRFGVKDVRAVGSGNVGATNVMRTAGKTAGVLAFLLDASKGAAAAWLAQQLAAPEWLPPCAALLAVLGHMFPFWLRFQGGKGVATGAGAFLPLEPWAVAAGVLAFALCLALARYVSLASLAGTLTLVAATFALHAAPVVSICAVLTGAAIVARHGTNIRRLWEGSENRLGGRRAEPAA